MPGEIFQLENIVEEPLGKSSDQYFGSEIRICIELRSIKLPDPDPEGVQ
jgi:hypothetical protein